MGPWEIPGKDLKIQENPFALWLEMLCGVVRRKTINLQLSSEEGVWNALKDLRPTLVFKLEIILTISIFFRIVLISLTTALTLVHLFVFVLPVLSVNGVVLTECDAVCIEMFFFVQSYGCSQLYLFRSILGSIPKVKGKKENNL